MSGPHGTRRAIAEISWEDDPGAIGWVGNRPVHSCWPLISAYFRDLLLPPHRRAEDESVSWNWHEPVNPPALTLAEIKSVRRQLESETQLFIENVSRGGRPGEAVGNTNQVDPEQLGAALREWVQQVVARSDAEFARYLCRTDQGLRIHSWGAAKASAVRFSDAKGLDLAGHVLVGGMPALHDVLLETGDGEMLAETPTDSLGAFRFSKLNPGKYRLRARSKRGTFPPHGVVVVLHQTSVIDLVLADDGPVAAPSRGRRSARSGTRRNLTIATVIAVLAGGAAWLGLNRSENPDTSTTLVTGEAASPASAARPATDARAVATAREQSSQANSNLEKPAGSVSPKSSLSPAAGAAADPLQAHATPSPGRRKENSASGVSAAAASAKGAAAITSPAGGASANQNRAGTVAGTPASPSIAPGPTASSGAPTPPVSAPISAPAIGASPASTTVAVSTTGTVGDVSPSAKSQPLPVGGAQGERAVTTNAGVEPTDAAVAATTRAELPVTPDRGTEPNTPASAEADRSATSGESVKAASSAVGNLASTAPVPATRDAPREAPVPSPSTRNTLDSEPKPAMNPTTPALRTSSARLTRTVRVRLAPWRVRLMEDSILPTQPLRAGQAEPVATLRQQILAEQKARLPATLTQSEVLSGLRVQIAPSDLTEGLAWRDEQGAVMAGSRVENGQAEIAWAAANAPVDRPVRLSGRNGVVLAEARYEPQTRELVVRTAEEAQAWLRWIIRAVPGDAARAVAGETAGAKPRFAWRTGTGNPVPTGWHATDATDAAADHRVDVPLGSVFGAVAAQSCALLDHLTGWALVTEVRQAADRPLGL